MKPRWLSMLLVASLVGNAVELGLYARAKWKQQREMDRFFRTVQHGTGMWTMRVVVPEFEPKMRMLAQRADRWALELQWQDWQQPPDSAIDRIALDSIASLARQQYYLLYQSRRALSEVKDEKLRQRMEKRWRGQMGLDN
jgi:hypothetical protein